MLLIMKLYDFACDAAPVVRDVRSSIQTDCIGDAISMQLPAPPTCDADNTAQAQRVTFRKERVDKTVPMRNSIASLAHLYDTVMPTIDDIATSWSTNNWPCAGTALALQHVAADFINAEIDSVISHLRNHCREVSGTIDLLIQRVCRSRMTFLLSVRVLVRARQLYVQCQPCRLTCHVALSLHPLFSCVYVLSISNFTLSSYVSHMHLSRFCVRVCFSLSISCFAIFTSTRPSHICRLSPIRYDGPRQYVSSLVYRLLSLRQSLCP